MLRKPAYFCSPNVSCSPKTTVKKLIILIGLCFSIRATSQQLTFRNESVDTLKIVSSAGHYHFDKKGTYTTLTDQISLVFDSDKQTYLVSSYKRTSNIGTFDPPKVETKEIKTPKPNINPAAIGSLLIALQNGNIQPTFDNIGITSDQFSSLTAPNKIIQVAKWHKSDWHFKKSFSTKEQNEMRFKGCQNKDTFNLYLKDVYEIGQTSYAMVTDVHNTFEIFVITKNNKHHFEGKYPNPFRQPWYEISDKSSTTINLSINSTLARLLSKQFNNWASLDFGELTNDYIEWYLKRRGIIF
jgi:hypothetical protein